jgi:hypothetical protein
MQPNPDAQMTRQQIAEALTAAGFPISAKTLATKATRGGGPMFRIFCGRAIYRWAETRFPACEINVRRAI